MRSVSFLHSTLGRLVIGCIALCALPRLAFADGFKKVDLPVAGDFASGHGKNKESIDLFDPRAGSKSTSDLRLTLSLDVLSSDVATSFSANVILTAQLNWVLDKHRFRNSLRVPGENGRGWAFGRSKSKFKVHPGHTNDAVANLLVSINVLFFAEELTLTASDFGLDVPNVQTGTGSGIAIASTVPDSDTSLPESVSVPEPAALITLSVGLGALAMLRRKYMA